MSLTKPLLWDICTLPEHKIQSMVLRQKIEGSIVIFPVFNMFRMKQVFSDTYTDESGFLTEENSKSEHENIKQHKCI